jgi:predicted GNAT family acetyltransferase
MAQCSDDTPYHIDEEVMSTLFYKTDSGQLATMHDSGLCPSTGAVPGLSVTRLSPYEQCHVLSLLSPDSLTNVIMAGFINDNSFTSPRNRGDFYACRNAAGELEGVALIGHTVLLSAQTSNAIKAFASVARRKCSKNLVMAERCVAEEFWKYYAGEQEAPRVVCPILFLRTPILPNNVAEEFRLRPATSDDLDHLTDAHAQMVQETSKVNPLQKDPDGFRQRYLRRIEKNRVWVLIRDGKLIFKADVLAELADAAYIEGVYVSPEQRGHGVGRQCMLALGQALRDRTKAIYLFVENQQIGAVAFYSKLGFEVAGQYELRYF